MLICAPPSARAVKAGGARSPNLIYAGLSRLVHGQPAGSRSGDPLAGPAEAQGGQEGLQPGWRFGAGSSPYVLPQLVERVTVQRSVLLPAVERGLQHSPVLVAQPGQQLPPAYAAQGLRNPGRIRRKYQVR